MTIGQVLLWQSILATVSFCVGFVTLAVGQTTRHAVISAAFLLSGSLLLAAQLIARALLA